MPPTLRKIDQGQAPMVPAGQAVDLDLESVGALEPVPETESGGDEGQILQQAFFAVFGTNSSLQGVFFVPSEMPACEGFAGRLLHGVDLGGPDRRYAPLVNMKIDSMSEDTAVVGMTIWLAELAGQAWKMTVVKRSGTWLISDIKDMGVW